MKQIELMQICKNLKPGTAINFNSDEILEAAEGELTSKLFDYVDQRIVNSFVSKIQKNWHVNISYDPISKIFIFYKPKEPQGCR